MQEIVIHYQSAEGVKGSVPVLLGDSYLSALQFVEEFLAEPAHYTIVSIKEAA